MSTTMKIVRYQVRDVARSRWLAAYTLFFLVATEGMLRFAGSGAKALVSLASIALFVTPLATIIFGTVYLYNARELIELMLAQPIRRRQLFTGLYVGLAFPLALGLIVGIAIPFVFHGLDDPALLRPLATLLIAGVTLTAIFVGLALLIALRADDRLRGLGMAIGLWLTLAIIYDGAVLFAVAMLGDHPIERPMIALMLANPIDLARVLVMLQLDIAALMGYTGAVLQRFFGGAGGIALVTTALALWVAGPVSLGARAFRRKDF
jgi:Cu-processing system permease protein